jgi:AraC-like DNA-binding protein
MLPGVASVNRNLEHPREYIRLWRPAGRAAVELYAARLLAYTYGKHFHEEYTIGINDAGLGSFWCRGAKHVAGPGSLNVLAPGEVHTGAAAAAEGWTYRNIYLAPEAVSAALRQFNWQENPHPTFCRPNIASERAWRAMDQAFRLLNSGQERLKVDTIFLLALRVVFEEGAVQRPGSHGLPRDSTVVNRARQYLQEHYRENITLDELAEVARVSPYYLIRRFRKEVGLPPHAYQLQLRLQSAKADLKSTAPLAGIAVQHGFFDQCHFHRHFKRAFGVTPGQYRKGKFVQDHDLELPQE